MVAVVAACGAVTIDRSGSGGAVWHSSSGSLIAVQSIRTVQEPPIE